MNDGVKKNFKVKHEVSAVDAALAAGPLVALVVADVAGAPAVTHQVRVGLQSDKADQRSKLAT